MMNQRGLTLTEKLVMPHNIERAIKKVKRNNGASGVDNMTVEEIESHILEYRKPFVQKLKEGTYKASPIKRVNIPKKDGSKRELGIPVVRDRVVQQMILQVINPIIDPHFSANSYGFRPGRNCQQAIAKAGEYYEENYNVVVDCDLKSYFDTINHQKLMHRMQWYIEDQTILQLIWNFLNAGVMDGAILYPHSQGAAQGGPLSPLLANVYLDQLDKELEKRGHRFVRYADDFVIFVQTPRAAERVLKSVTIFLEKKLRLTVNKEKSHITKAHKLEFLGYRLRKYAGKVTSRPTKSAKKRFKKKLKRRTSRKRPGNFETIVKEINEVTQGWINYYKESTVKTFLLETRAWLQRRLRQLIWKRWKKVRTKYRQLKARGASHDEAMVYANSRKSYWRISKSELLHRIFTNQRLVQWNLKDFIEILEK